MLKKFSELPAGSHNVVYVRKVDGEIMTFCRYVHSERCETHKSAAGLFICLESFRPGYRHRETSKMNGLMFDCGCKKKAC